MRLFPQRSPVAEGGDAGFREEYRNYVWRKVLFILVLALAMFVLLGYSVTVSGRDMTFWDGIMAIVDHLAGVTYDRLDDPVRFWNDYIVWNSTMPRVLGAVVCGAGLAVCGAAMQVVLNNPLAEPYTLGVSSGAVFGACLAIILGFTFGSLGTYGIIGNAFLFALVPCAIIIVLVGIMKGLSPVTMILAGTAVSYFFSGLTTLMMVRTDDETLTSSFRWQIGSLSGIGWDNLWIIFVGTVACTAVLMAMTKYLNVLATGDRSATSLGVDVTKVRYTILIVSSLMVAVILSFTGIIGFIGLLAPHMVRTILGADNRYVIPASMFLGPLILLFADTISRLLAEVDLPVGIVMMFVGSPIFLYILLGRRGRRMMYRCRRLVPASI
ncbi:MAG: iron ABC transporter permease [Candidatus Methanomethylophilaceae archaeon]|nr:iron ABC transporter permease [Candidatus Methanomethylophilaceae archaeon]